ncbi:hypothetical protein EK904_014295 [Melospiza melodia maxima]|nr:hypothetical protein EK904_014295 [Melospiza melodia maxima]
MAAVPQRYTYNDELQNLQIRRTRQVGDKCGCPDSFEDDTVCTTWASTAALPLGRQLALLIKLINQAVEFEVLEERMESPGFASSCHDNMSKLAAAAHEIFLFREHEATVQSPKHFYTTLASSEEWKLAWGSNKSQAWHHAGINRDYFNKKEIVVHLRWCISQSKICELCDICLHLWGHKSFLFIRDSINFHYELYLPLSSQEEKTKTADEKQSGRLGHHGTRKCGWEERAGEEDDSLVLFQEVWGAEEAYGNFESTSHKQGEPDLLLGSDGFL